MVDKALPACIIGPIRAFALVRNAIPYSEQSGKPLHGLEGCEVPGAWPQEVKGLAVWEQCPAVGNDMGLPLCWPPQSL